MSELETMSREAALLAAADADLDTLGDRLHDGALQELTGARYACDAVARGADPAVARDAVQHALVSLRRELWLLRPRGEHGLAAALSDLSEQLEAAGRPGLRLQADPVGALPPASAVMAYRLVQAVIGQTGQTGQTGAPTPTGVGGCCVLSGVGIGHRGVDRLGAVGLWDGAVGSGGRAISSPW